MNLSLRHKIISLVLSLLFIVTLTASIISIIELQKYFRQRIFDQLVIQLDEAEYLLNTLNPNFSIDRDYRYFEQYAEKTRHRLTLIDSAGHVLFDSNVPPDSLPALENHLFRPEIQMALHKGIGQNERLSATLQTPMFYVAKLSGKQGRIKFIRLALPLAEIQYALNTIQWKIILGGGMALALIAVISYLIAIRLTYPIHQLAQVARRIKNGDYDARFAGAADDEVGGLADLLNEILEKMNDDLVRMKKLERMRSQFLGNVSHELRTPIFSVQGYLETLIQNPDANPEKQKKFIRKAFRQAKRLNSLLTDLIDISRIESGEMKMTFRSFDIHKWLEKIVIEANESIGDQNVDILLANEADEHIHVLGDRERLKQVMHNLLTNAIKYNVDGGKVRIGYIVRQHVVEIFVSDTGRGIERRHIPHIFERFYRVDKERSRKVGGTGLGLAIVKHILEAHHSKVVVESEIGIGSRFSFRLVIAK